MSKTLNMFIENIKEYLLPKSVDYELLKNKEEVDRAHRRIEMLNFALAAVEYDVKKLKEEKKNDIH